MEEDIFKYFKFLEDEKEKSSKSCEHNNCIMEKDIHVCIDCGEEIVKKTTKDWKLLSHNDVKNVSDPNRVNMRKLEEKSIYKDVEGLGFSEKIVEKANKIYTEVTKDHIFRGSMRRSIVFACIYYSYRENSDPQSHDRLISIFGMEKKEGSRGLKYLTIELEKKKTTKTSYISPSNFINEILEKFDTSEKDREDVNKLYQKIHNKSSKINRSRPQSIAAGIVYYWILKNNRKITLEEFSAEVGLSSLTINKIIKEIKIIFKEGPKK